MEIDLNYWFSFLIFFFDISTDLIEIVFILICNLNICLQITVLRDWCEFSETTMELKSDEPFLNLTKHYHRI